MAYLFLVLLLGQLAVGVITGFKVSTVKEPVTAILDQIAVLGCSFTVTGASPLENIVITWQRTKTDEVVHSYYYGEDHLSKQQPQYSGRTSLFPEEFKNGNASLKLEGVRPEDTGMYMCYVSNTIGNDKGIISVQFAAYYKEPMLLIEQKPSSTVLTFESQGYPKADVFWYNTDNLEDSLLSKCSYQQTADGLYAVQSTMEINVTERSSNYTFILRNAAVNQTISRTVSFLIPEYSIRMQDLSGNYYAALVSCLLGTLLIIILIASAIIISKYKYTKQNKIKYISPDPP
ncbi:CD276 antigen-like [Heptranchias perlo]|uniref:CD276 antigen-like n=1 Tax=Heptranchias perlo TaxID=212740 RepID=UPI00355A3BFF